MIRIEIEGQDAGDALIQLKQFAAGLVIGGEHASDAGKAGDKIIEGLKDAVLHTRGEFTQTAERLAPAASTPLVNEIAAPRRGRPRKSQNTETAPAGAPASVPAAQPAVASNTGSEQPAELPAGDAASSAVTVTQLPEGTATATVAATTVTASLTPDQVRAKLQEFLTTPGGDAGLQLASKVLGKFGLTKVKQVNDAAPEVLHGIVAAVDAELKALS